MKCAPHMEKFATVGKMRHTWRRAAHLEVCGTLGNVRQTWKSALHLNLGKTRYT